MPETANGISDAFIAALWLTEVEPVVQLVTIESDSLEEPLRVCDDPRGAVSGGEGFAFYPFAFSWAAASREQPFGEARLEIANVDSRIAIAADTADEAPTITVGLARAAEPDTLELVMERARLTRVEGDRAKVAGVIRPRDFTTEPACRVAYTPERAEALF